MECCLVKFFLILLLLPIFGSAEIYKWVDEKGNVHFGDSPTKGDNAQKIEVDVISYEFVEVEDIQFYQPDPKETKRAKVEMFSAAWCGYCKKARQYFNEKKIPFVEYDIEKNSAANKRFKSLGGQGVPVILVGKKKMSGFSASRFESIYQ